MEDLIFHILEGTVSKVGGKAQRLSNLVAKGTRLTKRGLLACLFIILRKKMKF